MLIQAALALVHAAASRPLIPSIGATITVDVFDDTGALVAYVAVDHNGHWLIADVALAMHYVVTASMTARDAALIREVNTRDDLHQELVAAAHSGVVYATPRIGPILTGWAAAKVVRNGILVSGSTQLHVVDTCAHCLPETFPVKDMTPPP